MAEVASGNVEELSSPVEQYLRLLAWQFRVPSPDTASVLQWTSFVAKAMRLQMRLVTGEIRMGSHLESTAIRGFSDVDHGLVLQLAQNEDSQRVLRMLKRSLVEAVPWARSVRIDTPGVTLQLGPERTHAIEVIPMISYHGSHRGPQSARSLLRWRGQLPDGQGGWRPTAPPAYAALVDEADREHAVPGTANVVGVVDERGRVQSENRGKDSGTVRSSIRVLKTWKYLNDVPILSLYLSLQVLEIANKESGYIPVRRTVREAFRVMVDTQLAPVADPVIEGNLIDPCAGRNRERAMTAVRSASQVVEKDAAADCARPASEVAAWSQIFARHLHVPDEPAPFPPFVLHPCSDSEFDRWFATENGARAYLEYLRWDLRGVHCPRCGSRASQSRRHLWRCHTCRRSFGVLSGTRFDDGSDPREVLRAVWDDTENVSETSRRTSSAIDRTVSLLGCTLDGYQRGRAFLEEVHKGVGSDE